MGASVQGQPAPCNQPVSDDGLTIILEGSIDQPVRALTNTTIKKAKIPLRSAMAMPQSDLIACSRIASAVRTTTNRE